MNWEQCLPNTWHRKQSETVGVSPSKSEITLNVKGLVSN
jgi:hypothetical protein